MCRMLGLYPRRPIGASYLERFGRLAAEGCVPEGCAPGHADGWGVVLFREGHPAYLAREPNDASRDPAYPDMLEGVEALRPRGVVVAHLRKASLGSVSKENTQPFIHDQWAFAHNGTIHDFQKPVPLRLQGTTDSERYFKAILGAMERGLPFRDALAEVTSWIRSTHSFTSLTLLMSDGYSLYGYREFADLPEYYTLYYARRDDAVVFSQEPLDEGPWRLMENRQLLTVGSDLSLSFRQL